MKELDLPLRAYVERAYDSAPAEERRAFARLLEQADDRLWLYFYGNAVPDDPCLAELVRKILSSHKLHD
jgi:succinate dehydrogenase flavin-adding protein (antitoxin of CptAB toxin-antitoxin module)